MRPGSGPAAHKFPQTGLIASIAATIGMLLILLLLALHKLERTDWSEVEATTGTPNPLYTWGIIIAIAAVVSCFMVIMDVYRE